MEDSVETALAYSLATLLVLGGVRMYYEFVKLWALRDIRRERPTLPGWLKTGFLPSFLASFAGAYGLSRGSVLGARGDFLFWFAYLLFTLLVLVSFARQAARREGARPEDKPPVSVVDPIAWLRKKMGEEEKGNTKG